MAHVALGFEDFIQTVDTDSQAFVKELHQVLSDCGCKIEVKEAKSGYVVSYTWHKKTIANYVFRKKGLLVRLYANHLGEYMAFLDTLPPDMVKAIGDAPICKRLVKPDACNAKCPMGYEFLLQGQHHQKCRFNAFLFLVCTENNPAIRAFFTHELKACGAMA